MPGSYDPTQRVPGPEAALTMLGLAIGLVVGLFRPEWAIGAAIGGVVLIALGLLVKKTPTRLAGRLGLGLAVGAVVLFALVSLNVLTPLGR
jgi:uncharacterized protein YqgC (DUF456 family)